MTMEWRRKWEKEEKALMEKDDVGAGGNGLLSRSHTKVKMEWHEEEVEGVGKVRMQQVVWMFYEKPHPM